MGFTKYVLILGLMSSLLNEVQCQGVTLEVQDPDIMVHETSGFVAVCITLETPTTQQLQRDVNISVLIQPSDDTVKLSSMDITYLPPVTNPLRCVNITFEENGFGGMDRFFSVIFTPSNDNDIFVGGNVANVTLAISNEDINLEEGVDYITFFDLAFKDSTVKQEEVEADFLGQESSDFYSSPIFIENGIPIGAKGEISAVLYVLSDGAITFDRPIRLHVPLEFPLQADLQILSVFLANHDSRVTGLISYAVYTSAKSQNVQIASSFIKEKGFSGDFTGTWMLVAEWNGIPMYPGKQLNTTNTYQAVVISDGIETYSIFTYNCERINWIGGADNYASVGFNVQSNMENFQSFANHDLSRTPDVGMIACNHTSLGIPWSNAIYRIGMSVNDLQRGRSRCLDQVVQDELRYNVSTELLHNLPAELSDCPCSLFQVERDRRFFADANDTFLDEAVCYFSRFPRAYSSESTVKIFYRCCYSMSPLTAGSLISTSRDGHGSVLLFLDEDEESFEEAVDYTVGFQDACCGGVGLCSEFYNRRICSTCASYNSPIFSWGLGDPHINTLDGGNYTFNGWGEYTLTEVGDFKFQGRTAAVNASVNGSATQFSAFAFGITDAIVEVRLGNDEDALVFLNSKNITDTLAEIDDTNSESKVVFLQRSSESSVTASFANGVSVTVTQSELSVGILSFVAALPLELHKMTSGLLGNFNEDSSDDFIYPDGSILDGGEASDEDIHDFGQSWFIDPESSLFTYPPGLSSANFSFPDHIPLFMDEVIAAASDEVQDTCAASIRCIFDATQTGSLDIGLETMEVDQSNQDDQTIASNFPPKISGPEFFMVTLNQEFVFTIGVLDNNLFSFSIISEEVEGEVLTRSETDTSLWSFTWTPTSIIENPIVFVAKDDMGATSQYEPQIRFCQCQNGAECTLQGVLDPLANPLDLYCICSAAYEGRYCGGDANYCSIPSCYEGVECSDNPIPLEGVTCGPCPQGLSGDGIDCSEFTTEAITIEETTSSTEIQLPTTELVTLPLPDVVKENAIVISLSNFTLETFDADKQQLFKEETARAINVYCTDPQTQCGVVEGARSRRQLEDVRSSDIILTNIRSANGGGVDFDLYTKIDSSGTSVLLNQQALLQAVENNSNGYKNVGFQDVVVQAVTVLTTPSPQTMAATGSTTMSIRTTFTTTFAATTVESSSASNGGLSGSVIAGGTLSALIGVILLGIIILLVIYVIRKAKSGNWTPSTHQQHYPLQQGDNVVVREDLVLTNATYDQLNRNPEAGRHSKRGRDLVDVNKMEYPVDVEAEVVKKKFGDKMRVGSMMEVKVNLAAADDEQKITSL